MVFIEYVVCLLAILIAGSQLAKYGDIIGTKTGLGRTFVGLVMLATVTSLPELSIGISSVALHNLPDIAAGDVFGSCLFNLLLLSLIDGCSRQMPLTARLGKQHMLLAAFSILSLCVAGMAMTDGDEYKIGHVGLASFLLLAIYAIAMFCAYKMQASDETTDESETRDDKISLRKAIILYCFFASLVIAAGGWIPSIAEQIAELTGMEQDFVGTTFVALSTSLPEVVTTLAAVKLGAFDMAAANVLGSNLFNSLVLAIDDFFYSRGPLLQSISDPHLTTIFGTMAMTAIFIAGVCAQKSNKKLGLAPDAIALILVFVTTLALMYAGGLGEQHS